jgi:hypothetical protein
MARRRGDITCGDLKRNWPHVELPAAMVRVSRTVKSSAALRTRYWLLLTCSSAATRDFVMLCFAKPEAFAERFGGIGLALVPR